MYMKKLLLLLFTLSAAIASAQIMTVAVPQDNFEVCPTDVVDVSAVRSTPTNNSIAMNGIDEFFSIPSSPSINFGTASFTVEFYVLLNNSFGINYLVTNRNAAGQGWAIFTDNNGFVGFGVRDNVGGFDVLTGNISAINDANWHHVAVTWDRGSTEVNIYVDGGFEASKLMSVGDVGTTSPITIGTGVSPFSGASTFVNGEFDEFRMWNGARSVGDIQTHRGAHLNPNSSTFSDLAIYFDFTACIFSNKPHHK